MRQQFMGGLQPCDLALAPACATPPGDCVPSRDTRQYSTRNRIVPGTLRSASMTADSYLLLTSVMT
jgi:hypothetical protein